MSGFPAIPGTTPAGVYQGAAYHTSFPNGKADGRIAVNSQGVHFDGGTAGGISLPLNGLIIKKGGATADLILISHPSQPEWTIYTSNKAIMRDPSLGANPGVASQLGGEKRRTACCLFGCGSILFLVLAAIYGIIQLREPAARAIAAKVPVEWETKLGDLAFLQIKASTRLVEDKDLIAQLEILAKPLLDAIPEEDKRYTFKLHLAADETPNAFALPGGNVVVNSGLILKADRPEEVAGVLAHEIAHVTKQHSIRSLVSQAGLFLFIQAVVGDVSGLSGIIVEGGQFLLTQKYSRDYEQEADETGWEYMNRANLDPRGLVDFFQKLKKLEASLGGASDALALLSTHPATSERIRWLDQRWEKQEQKDGFKQIDIDFKGFQEKLKTVTPEKKKVP